MLLYSDRSRKCGVLIYWLFGFLGHLVDVLLKKVPVLGSFLSPDIESYIESMSKTEGLGSSFQGIQTMSQLYTRLLRNQRFPTRIAVSQPRSRPNPVH